MAIIKLLKVDTTPDTWLADAIYYVKEEDSDIAEAFITSTDGLPVGIANTDAMTEILADPGFLPSAIGYTPEDSANKGIAGGYAGLDGAAQIPAIQLPSYVDDVLEYDVLASFPAVGVTGIIYVALDTNKSYRWTGSTYVEISASPGTTDNLSEGSVNLYFTNARVNTFLTTWAGSAAITTLGTIVTGIWHGTQIADDYIASAAVWTAKQAALGYTAENTANKNQINGYAGLDSGGKVAAAQLPSYVDDVLEYSGTGTFPVSGTTGIIYVALDTNKVYRWTGSVYTEISPSPGSTDSVPEGSLNLYYTAARVNTLLAAFTGSANIVTLGTITTGTWHGSAIADLYISSSATWNAKQAALGFTPENAANRNIAGGYAPLDGSAKVPVANLPTVTATIAVNLDGQGTILTTGQKGYVRVPYAATITGWSIVGDVSGSCVFDVWKSASFPTVANTITASAKPTLTSATNTSSTTLTGWTTSINSGDIIGWNLDSVSTLTRAILQLTITKT
jgi:hypothetical protein